MSPKDKLSESDPVLGRLIAAMPEPHIDSTHDVFFDLMSCVLEQQIHYRSTKKVFEKMLAAASLDRLTPDNFHILEQKAFPKVNLAAAKRETALRVVDFWDGNPLDWHSLEDDAVRGTLSSIGGVGRWSIDMILLYTLERPNVFPYDDFHLKLIMTDLYDLDPSSKLKAQMVAVSGRWGDRKSLAVKYLLAWKELRKKILL